MCTAKITITKTGTFGAISTANFLRVDRCIMVRLYPSVHPSWVWVLVFQSVSVKQLIMLSLQGRSAQRPGTIPQPPVPAHLSAHARWVGCLRLPACQWIYVFNTYFLFPLPQHFSGSCLNALWLSLSLVLPLCPSVWQRTISPGESQSCILAVYVNVHLSAAYSIVKSCQALSSLLPLLLKLTRSQIEWSGRTLYTCLSVCYILCECVWGSV